MSLYLVERALPGITTQQLGAFLTEVVVAGRRMTAAGESVRYLRSSFLPGPSRCLCLFEAASPQLVKHLNDSLHFPYSRIFSVIEFLADDVCDSSPLQIAPECQ